MQYQEFEKELSAKKRSIDDLIRYICTRTDQNPNYTLLLGAGCSISSGIRSAAELSNLWRKELYERYVGSVVDVDASVEVQKEFLQRKHGNWYDASREYSSLFEQRYDLQRQRRMFVETEVSGKTPSIGYVYLTALVEQNYINTVFTTNFDDLLNEAFYGYSDLRPIVCAHDSSINSVTITSKRPKIIKLHGDYLFDDLKSTNRETESLEQNMKSKFAEFAKDYGLVVLGYSGGDRSVMDVLSSLLKNDDYFKGGIYWCIRRGSDISEDLRKLVWKERVYFVEIDGFDGLMADIYSRLNSGRELPQGLWATSRRPTDLASKLLSNTNGFDPDHPVLMRAKEHLEKQTKKTALLNLIAKPDEEDKGRPILGNGLNDDEFYLLMEIQNLIAAESFHSAIEKARASLRNDVKVAFRSKMLRLIVQAYEGLDEYRQSLSVVDELIQLQPRISANYLLRASLLSNEDEKMLAIEKAIEVDHYSVDALYEKARILNGIKGRLYGASKAELVRKIDGVVNLALNLDPSWRNPCWGIRFNLQSDLLPGIGAAEKIQKEIVDLLKMQNLYSSRLFSFRESLLSRDSDEEDFSEFFADLEDAESRLSEESKFLYSIAKINAASKLRDHDRLNVIIRSYLDDPELVQHEGVARAVGRVLRSVYANDLSAVDLLQRTLDAEFDADVLQTLIEVLCDLGETDRAAEVYKKWSQHVRPSLRHEISVALSDARGSYENSLHLIASRKTETGVSEDEHCIYLWLKLKNWSKAEEVARAYLSGFNYSVDAVAPIVNLELACKMQDKKVNTSRTDEILKLQVSAEVLAAVYALRDNRVEMLRSLKRAIELDKAFRFRAQDWPVFDKFRSDSEFLEILAVDQVH